MSHFNLSYLYTNTNVMDREKVDLVICKYTMYRTEGRLGQDCGEKMSPMISQGRYDRNSVLCALADRMVDFTVWNKLYKGNLWKNIRFPVGHVYEDVDTFFRIIDLCKAVYVINSPLYLYRKHLGSITRLHTLNNLKDWNLAYSHFETYINENTPNVFSSGQLREIQQMRMNVMLYNYGSDNWEERSEDEVSSDSLRSVVIELGEQVDIKRCTISSQICYAMVCRCPRVYKAIFPWINFTRHSIKMIQGMLMRL